MLTTKTEGTKLTKRPGEASPAWPLRGFGSPPFIDFVSFEFFVNFVAQRA